jgi:EAL domain-containing protein (putative c-di-GMP-specific phosphodiesterase class I)
VPYEIHYDISAVVIILILLYMFYTYKRFISVQSRIYLGLLLNSLAAISLDIVTCYTIVYFPEELLVWNNLLCILHILFTNSIPVLYYLYIFFMTHEKTELSLKNKLPVTLVCVYEFATITTSPFTHYIMYFDGDGVYKHGPGMTVLYIIAILFVFLGLYQIMKYRKNLDVGQRSVSIFYSIAATAASIVQYFHPTLLLTGMAIAISLFLAYLNLQNPLEFVDSTYGAYNRTAFKEIIFEKLDTGQECSLVIVKITNIENIKKQFGIENGYYIIRQFTKRLNEICRDRFLFHLFGVCYVFVCRDKKESFSKVDALTNFLQAPVAVNIDRISADEVRYPVTAELFILEDILSLKKIRHVKIDDIIDMIRYAVTSTSAGEDLNYIDDTVIEQYQKKITIQETVQQAIDNESFEVFLQPIFDLRSKKFVGAESLVRLKGADGKYIPPLSFIPEAEINGDILQISDIVLRKTCEFINAAHLDECGIRMVNINLSMIQCMQDEIVEHLVAVINEYGVPVNMVQFEITETMIENNQDRLAKVMERFAFYGIPVALDDFGTGYSNTARLMHYHFAEVKFDKSLVDTAENDTGNMISLKHLMSMVKEAGMLALAEGVETLAVSDKLESLGCDLVQGYYYAKPMPCDQFKEFMKAV